MALFWALYHLSFSREVNRKEKARRKKSERKERFTKGKAESDKGVFLSPHSSLLVQPSNISLSLSAFFARSFTCMVEQAHFSGFNMITHWIVDTQHCAMRNSETTFSARTVRQRANERARTWNINAIAKMKILADIT